MKKDKQMIETEVWQCVMQELEDTLHAGVSPWEPVGFLPCTMLQQFVHDADLSGSIWDILSQSLSIEITEVDLSHLN